MKIFVINGPSINMLGIREPDIYGKESYSTLISNLEKWSKELDVDLVHFQSNIEGEIVDFIQKAYFEKADGIIINPAAYTHTSIAILDALKATSLPAIEVHLSDISQREEYRKFSYISGYVFKTIKGEGINGYHHALKEMKEYLKANG